MRERILEAIYRKLDLDPENEKLQRQITLLNKASICTIDSFCLDIIKNNLYQIEISPNFRIGDSTEIELLKLEALDEIFEKKYETQDEDFRKLLEIYTSYRDDTPLKDLILKIYTYIQSAPFPEEWLEEKIEMFNLENRLKEDFSTTVWGKLLLKEVEEELIDDIKTLEQVKKYLQRYQELEKFSKTITSDIINLNMLKDKLYSWDTAYAVANNLEYMKWPIDKKIELDEKEMAKKTRDNVKKKLNKKLEKILIVNSENANQDIYDMYTTLTKLKNLILEFGELFIKRKREKNILDFNDIEHLALNILVKNNNGKIEKTELGKKYEEKYSEIAIDEYQDSNLVQEYILTSISNGKNIFMVGDVKQSIYKFRQARPDLFLDKYNTYKLIEEKQPEDDLKIQLFKNFRSRDIVLEFTNIIFENIMSPDLGDIDYNEQEYLNLGAHYEDTKENLKVELNIIDLKEDANEDEEDSEDNIENIHEKTTESAIEKVNEKIIGNPSEKAIDKSSYNETDEEEQQERIENVELEAKFVANKIKELMDNKYKIYDAKKQQFRDIKYKDIVILLRSTKELAPIYEKEILNLEMPVFSDASTEYLDSIEITTIISLLKVIDNPHQDIPLITLLRSSIGKFTDNDLVKIRLTDKNDDFYNTLIKSRYDVNSELKDKIERILNFLETWREEQEYLPLDELIWKIYTDTGFYNYVGLMPNGALRQANLKMLFERARQFETVSFKGLFNFVNFIEKLRLNNGDFGSAKLIGENEDVIRIMSIHKSKGLEFPVVFLSSTGKQFNMMDLNNNILLHQDLGIGAKYINYDMRIEYDTLTKAAIKNKLLTENLSEEMRILYVALTRAKEKLIITGISKDQRLEEEKMKELVNIYEKEGNKINFVLLKKYKKYLDWINLVYLYDKNLRNIVDFYRITKKDILKGVKQEKAKQINVIEKIENEDLDLEQLVEIKKIIEYEYKYKKSINIPRKTSVTKIKQMESENTLSFENKLLYEELIVESIENKQNKEDRQNKEIFVTLPKPQFLNENKEIKITPTEKGTLVHLCMQKLDEKKDYTLNDIKELINKLQESEIITQKEAEAINPSKVYSFTKSNIWKELKQAKHVYKEKSFYINIPAKDIYKEDVEENILVQGIIDLFYIDKNDNIVLLDYKTDYVSKGNENILIEKYKKQLELYKDAIENALDQKVSKVYIYSTCLEKEIEIIM